MIFDYKIGELQPQRRETLTLYLIEAPFDAFANRADPDQTTLMTAA